MRIATCKDDIKLGSFIEIKNGHSADHGVADCGVVVEINEERISFERHNTKEITSWFLTDAGLANYKHGTARNPFNRTYVLEKDEYHSRRHWDDIHRDVTKGIVEGRIEPSGALRLLGF